jgi:hypothetical protein
MLTGRPSSCVHGHVALELLGPRSPSRRRWVATVAARLDAICFRVPRDRSRDETAHDHNRAVRRGRVASAARLAPPPDCGGNDSPSPLSRDRRRRSSLVRGNRLQPVRVDRRRRVGDPRRVTEAGSLDSSAGAVAGASGRSGSGRMPLRQFRRERPETRTRNGFRSDPPARRRAAPFGGALHRRTCRMFRSCRPGQSTVKVGYWVDTSEPCSAARR